MEECYETCLFSRLARRFALCLKWIDANRRGTKPSVGVHCT